MAAKFIIKLSESGGGYSNRFGRGLTWGKWRTVNERGDLEAAKIEADRMRNGRTMTRCAVFHGGKIVYKSAAD